MKRMRIFEILLKRKGYLFTALLIFISIQFYWSQVKKTSRNQLSPTPDSWTFYKLPSDRDEDGPQYSWLKLKDTKSSLSDLDWQQSFNPDTSDYDVHMEFTGVRMHSNTNLSSPLVAKSSSRLSDSRNASSNVSETFDSISFPSAEWDVSGLLIEETVNHASPGVLNVAIGGGLTSSKLLDLNENTLTDKMQLFKTFLPSFCKTIVAGKNGKSQYNYHFYFAYDYTDKVLDGLARDGSFQRAFAVVSGKHCPSGTPVFVHFVQCDHTKHPAWAQNDAMVEAYLDNADYFYRINDDTLMKTVNWTAMFIEVLNKYSPTNVGVVGPNHSGGNVGILTYDFVHKTHVDVFGFHYPRLFTDWWGDNWITMVYRPTRSTKMHSVYLQHTLALGQRYGVRDWGVGNKLTNQLVRDKITLERYIRHKKMIEDNNLQPSPTRVIAMALYSSKPRHTWGAIRNAQLARILFPEWKLRFYVSRFRANSSAEEFSENSPSPNVDLHDHSAINISSSAISRRLLKRLRLLGAEVKLVDDRLMDDVPSINWRNLVIMDDEVEWFLVRNVDSRLTESEASAVKKWIVRFRKQLHSNSLSFEALTDFLNSFVGFFSQDSTKKPSFLHVIRDLPRSVLDSFPSGMWGGNARVLRILLEKTLQAVVGGDSSNNGTSNSSSLLELKVKSFNISNPYLNPGIEELIRSWSRQRKVQSSGNDREKLLEDLYMKLAARLTVHRLDHITCFQEADPSSELSFAGQRFDEHELPYLDNHNTTAQPVYDNIAKILPGKLCKTVHDIVARAKPTSDLSTSVVTRTTKKASATTTSAAKKS